MFKLNKFKILLLLMLFAFAGQEVWGDNAKYYSYHIIDVKPSGAGKVYSTTKTENGANTNFNACVDPPYTQTWHTGNSTNTLYLLAKANDGYVFSHWEDQNGNTVASSNPGQVSAHCAQNNSDSGPGDYNGTYYAVFVPSQAVEVYTENADFGTASISNSQNEIGQTVTLTAHENLFQHAFVGWRKESNGQIVSKENPYTFTITEQTQGKYYAVFRDDYSFYRIKNYETGRYMVATNDQGGITNLSSFSLISGIDNVIYDAGSIVQVRIHYAETTAHTREYAIIVQGEDTQEITGAYLRMDRVEVNELTLWEPNADGIRAKDNGGENVSLNFYSSADNTKWFFEKLDLDLEGENYFSLDPSKLVEVGGKYYTTLRTSWNILFNPEQMTPYVVTKVNDEQNGTFEMTPLTGNIIPAGTPVIIETNSNDIEENRMVPTMTAASDAVPSGNLLKVSEKYFPNQSAPVANCKGLTVKDGQLAFGGGAMSTVNGNEAYLSVANDVILPNKIPNVTLAELLENGDTEKTYCVTDLTCVYARGNVLYCKDDNNAIRRSEMNEGEIDYVRTVAELQTRDWDQSNWVAVKLPSEANPNYLDHRLTKVVGRLTNTVNPEFEVTVAPSIGDENPYDENNYITCNFSGSHQANVTINNVEHNYYFVEPKPMEIANVKWALWNGETFSKPSNASSDLKGEFAADFSFTGVPQSTGVYNFPALIKIAPTAQGVMPRAQDEATTSWLVFPLELTNQPVTSVEDLNTGKTAVKVVYYNLMGVESAVPHNGVNIVETRYSDGTRTTTKIIR